MAKKDQHDLEEFELARGEDLLPTNFPELTNLSAGFMFNFVPRPQKYIAPEFVYIPINPKISLGQNYETKAFLTIAQWNSLWEAGQLRPEFVPQVITRDFPAELNWLKNLKNTNLYLIPDTRKSKYEAFQPLYHLLPLRILHKYNLPALIKGHWPPLMSHHLLDKYLKNNFDEKLAMAFSSHIWPLLDSGSKKNAFSKDYPLILLSQNLNFWLPFSFLVAENRLREFPRVKIEDSQLNKKLIKIRKDMPSNIYVDSPRCGGSIWCGEDDAWEATKEIVNLADKNGRLREIIDAVRSNHVEDDFSNCWSFAKEDFERKIYHKRNKFRVTFVEFDDSIPVHGPTSELHEDLLWEDFLGLLSPKEKRVIICLRNGNTKLGDIAHQLGYANHSAISKALSRIRKKAMFYIGNS